MPLPEMAVGTFTLLQTADGYMSFISGSRYFTVLAMLAS
jgi:hypothetical protein